MILFLKKCWTWIKSYWKAILLILVIVPVFFILRKEDIDYIKEYILKQKKFFKKEVEIIENSEKEKQDKIEQEKRNLEESKKILEEKYKKKFNELDKKNKQELKDMSKELKENPEDYVKRIAEENGWEFVE